MASKKNPTRYIVSATSQHEAKTFARKETAIKEAEMRAKSDKTVDVTVVTSTGKEVHRVAATVKAELVQAKAKAPRVLREALGESPVEGWETLYDKSARRGFLILRSTEGAGYAMYCVKHEHLHNLARLSDDRRLAREGGWCSSCTFDAVADEVKAEAKPKAKAKAKPELKLVTSIVGSTGEPVDGETAPF